MSLSHAGSVSSLLMLNELEKEILDTINNMLADGETKRIVEVLPTYLLNVIYAFAEKSPQLNKLCSENETLNAHWSGMLHKLNYPSHKIVSFDRQLELSVFSQLKGAFLLSQLKEHRDITSPAALTLLKKACDIGMYQAMIMHLNFTSELIVNEKKLEEDEVRIHLFLNDVHKLSNLYWTVGHLDAVCILFKLIDYFFKNKKSGVERFFSQYKFSWNNAYHDKKLPFPIVLLEVAVENLYIARLIEDFEESKTLVDQLMQGNAFAGFKGEINNYADLEKKVKRKMEEMHILEIDRFFSSAREQAVSKIKKHYPHFTASQGASLSY